MAGQVHVIDHPLVQHKLSLMRMKSTSTSAFRNLLGELSMLMAYEVTRDLHTHEVPIETPLTRMNAPMLDGKKIVLVSILRAGTGILDGMLRLIPSARVGHVGLYRDPKTLVAVEYYFKVPKEMAGRDAIIVDPDDGHRQLRGGRGGPSARDASPLDQVRLPADVPGGAAGTSTAITPTSPSTRRRSTAISTTTATSSPGWATRAIVSTERSSAYRGGVPKASGPKASGRSSPSVVLSRTPSGPQRWTRVAAAANSFSCWRHRPHGGQSSAPSVRMTTSTISRSPAVTMAAMAALSAHSVRPYDAFSTLVPACSPPLAVRRQAPTRKRE